MKLLLPLLSGWLAVVSLFAPYAFKVAWADILPGLILATVLALFFSLLFYASSLTRKGWSVSAAIATYLFMAWFDFPSDWIPFCIIVVLLVVFYFVQTQPVVKPMTIIVACMLVASMSVAAVTGLRPSTGKAEVQTASLSVSPNIYLIIPDRMPSPAAMREFGIDPSAFVSALEDRGFYVKDDQQSQDGYTVTGGKVPTTRTFRFVASILNYGIPIAITTDYRTVSKLYNESSVARTLHKYGYRFENIGSWFGETSTNAQADKNYLYEGHTVMQWFLRSEFSQAIINRSAVRGWNFEAWTPLLQMHQLERERLQYQIDTTLEVANDRTTPHFVFAHLLIPHPPYVWKADGTLEDARTTAKNATAQSIQQIQYTETLLVSFVDKIRAIDPSGIIIIQADEGTGYSFQELNLALSDRQWNGVLSVWDIPTDMRHTEILGYVLTELGMEREP